jgi:hypothetical protein
MKDFFRTSGIPLVLIPCLVISPIWAQSSQAVSDLNSQASSLTLRVVEEPHAVSAAGFAPAKRLTVQVQDESGRPVSDAAVAFRLPDTSVSGTFADGAQSAVAYTDASGVAHVDGIRWIASSGSVPVRITATKGNSHAGLLFEEKMSASVAGAVAAAPLIHGDELAAKQPIALTAPAVPAPGVAAVAEVPPVSITSPPGEVAAVVPAAHPSVSISNFTRSSSAATTNSLRPNAGSSVSISNSPEGYSSHSSLKKWLIWTAVIAAGAGAGFAFSGRSSSSSSSSVSSSSSTIGTPTINIGH